MSGTHHVMHACFTDGCTVWDLCGVPILIMAVEHLRERLLADSKRGRIVVPGPQQSSIRAAEPADVLPSCFCLCRYPAFCLGLDCLAEMLAEPMLCKSCMAGDQVQAVLACHQAHR